MGDIWFYVQDKRKLGPVTREQLQQLAGSGQVRRTDMVLKAGTPQWHPAADVPGLLAAFAPEVRPLPPLDPLATTRKRSTLRSISNALASCSPRVTTPELLRPTRS